MASYKYTHIDKDIYFLLADITDLKVDVIINFVTRKLSYQNKLNDAIMNKGGKTVELSLKSKWIPSYFTYLITQGGDLPCKKIIHTVLIDEKPNNQGYFDTIKEKYSKCLEKAEQEKFQSVAFPIICPDSIEKIFCLSLDSVLSSYTQTAPKEIYFVCKEKSKLHRLISELKSKLSPSTCPMVLYDGPLQSAQRQNWMTSTSSVFSETFSRNDRLRNDYSKTSPERKAMLQAEAAAEPTPMDTETSDATDSNNTCIICLCDITDRETLKKCGHSFCSACIHQSFDSVGPFCPICQMVYGKVTGLQPRGTMTVHKEWCSLPGFPDYGMYVINYDIPSGIQEKCHPSPGNQFHGTRRTAYLPASPEGETVLKMLQRAFQQKLIFTIGISRTTNQSDTVTWNDIHHKTNISGGSYKFGYPDDNYLNRVMAELEAKGIDAKSVAGEKIVNVLTSK